MSIKLRQQTAAEVPIPEGTHLQLFVDVADGGLKAKDSTGTVILIGGASAAPQMNLLWETSPDQPFTDGETASPEFGDCVMCAVSGGGEQVTVNLPEIDADSAGKHVRVVNTEDDEGGIVAQSTTL